MVCRAYGSETIVFELKKLHIVIMKGTGFKTCAFCCVRNKNRLIESVIIVMKKTLLEEIWSKTLEKLGDKPDFKQPRINELREAAEENKFDEIEAVITKEYEDQNSSN
jgi:hypothetical protein